MKNIKSIKNCSGCRACEQVCPINCISLVPDDEGFLYPQVKSECINCGKCLIVCPQQNDNLFQDVKATYAAISNNYEELMKSSSGGLMSALADVILDEEGIVFGAYLDSKDWNCKYIGINNEEDLDMLRGSKYLQSDTQNTFSEVKTCLEKGKKVMFVGVPCQVAGLKSYLQEEYPNLYLVDILCHGATSPLLFHEHVKYLEKKYKDKLVDFTFRDKSKFPNKSALKYKFLKKEKVILGKCEFYYSAFISGATYRMCCYECAYAQKDRVGDITLGDYWGIRKIHKAFDNTLGASLVLVNTEKGSSLLDRADVLLEKSELDKAIIGNGILVAPSRMHPSRNFFYKDIQEIGYERAMKKNIKVKPMLYNWILSHLPKKMIRFLSTI